MLKAIATATVGLLLSGCLPLLAVAYDQRKQEREKEEREIIHTRATQAYERESARIDARAKPQEEAAASLSTTRPRAGCLMLAQTRHGACQEKAAILARSESVALRSASKPAECDSAFKVAQEVCAAYPETAQ